MFIKSFVISVIFIMLASCKIEFANSEFASVELKMIPIPGGSFQMGCVRPRGCGSSEMQVIHAKGGSLQGCYSSYFDCEDDEKPVHQVNVKPFFMSATEVTFTQWDACVEAGGCKHKPNDEGWGRSQRPVVNVSWDDAQEYVKWLSKEKGHTYRLPTEAEWEYAARAGSNTKYSFGNNKAELCRYANHADQSVDDDHPYRNESCSDGIGRKTAKVGSYQPNQWGLYDMHGNVVEWTCSIRTKKYNGSESNCINASDASASKIYMILRGGSWSGMADHSRSAGRSSITPDYRDDSAGFRVVRIH